MSIFALTNLVIIC